MLHRCSVWFLFLLHFISKFACMHRCNMWKFQMSSTRVFTACFSDQLMCAFLIKIPTAVFSEKTPRTNWLLDFFCLHNGPLCLGLRFLENRTNLFWLASQVFLSSFRVFILPLRYLFKRLHKLSMKDILIPFSAKASAAKASTA